MLAFALQRTAQMVFVIFGVITLTFFAIRLVPGDPARLMEPPGTPESVLDLTRQKLGTDKPISQQYVDFLKNLAQGDMGTSFRGGRPVAPTVLESVPNTLALGAISMVITTVIAFTLGIVASRKPNGVFDRLTLTLSSIAQATPGFLAGRHAGVALCRQFALVSRDRECGLEELCPAGGHAGDLAAAVANSGGAAGVHRNHGRGVRARRAGTRAFRATCARRAHHESGRHSAHHADRAAGRLCARAERW